MLYDVIFYDDDDPAPRVEAPLARSRTSRKIPGIGEAITLVERDGVSNPRRYRVTDVDHGYVAQHQHNNYSESTVAVYVIAANDPRRTGR